jgi:hypothetical protein
MRLRTATILASISGGVVRAAVGTRGAVGERVEAVFRIADEPAVDGAPIDAGAGRNVGHLPAVQHLPHRAGSAAQPPTAPEASGDPSWLVRAQVKITLGQVVDQWDVPERMSKEPKWGRNVGHRY